MPNLAWPAIDWPALAWPAVDWPALLAFVVAIPLVWLISGGLKLRGWLREGDARKLCHAAALVGGALWFGRLSESAARPTFFLAAIGLFPVLLLVCAGRSIWPLSWMFRGYARTSDAPHEAWHVWSSWLVSLVGVSAIDGMYRDLVLTRTVVLVLGIADGVAEPVGSRWGRHRFNVPPLMGGKLSTRSLEGSLAVALATWLTILVFYPRPCDPVTFAILAAIVGLSVAIAEAVTPHGLDNLTIPLVCGVQLQLLM